MFVIPARVRCFVLLAGCLGGCSGKNNSSDSKEGSESGGADGAGGETFASLPIPKDLPSPATPGLWRLTERQYQNSLRDLLGPDVHLPDLKVEQSAGGLAAIAAGTTTASDQDVERYEMIATNTVTETFGSKEARSKLVSCATNDAVNAACTKSFVVDFGRRAFRRELSTKEVDRYMQLSASASALAGNDWDGLQAAVSSMLQSPKFIYRFELGTPDPKTAKRNVLDAYERASRLSFLFWDSTPDKELLDAAQSGDLMASSGMRTQARRLWSNARTRKMWRSFIDENYRLNDLARSAAQVSPELLASMKEEVLRSAEAVAFDEKTGFLSFFSRDKSFVDPLLRSHYGLPNGGSGFETVQFPAEQERMGFFGSAAFLTLTSTSLHTSPTARGKFIRERVLCQEVPAPMAGVDTSLPPPSATARTTRERLDAHRNSPQCAACHDFMDPPGYAFERFDQLGKYRTTENGAEIRTDGSLDPDGKTAMFKGARELTGLLLKEAEASTCLARGILRQSTGYLNSQMETDADSKLVGMLAEILKARNFEMEPFFTDLVGSDAFVTRQAEVAQ